MIILYLILMHISCFIFFANDINSKNTKTMASGPITSWQIGGENVETVSDFIFLGSKITAMVIAAMKLKDTCSLVEQLWQT